jgi:hypothetical protein
MGLFRLTVHGTFAYVMHIILVCFNHVTCLEKKEKKIEGYVLIEAVIESTGE